ncbi:MAG: hypothetical protein M0036_14190 [Desulfobacteraceae bacterium]|nr:hypothetical protein [Desulfobacteraceae bacterium]
MSSIFGWSYPPGCSGPPDDDGVAPCEICGEPIDNCICPVCPVCGAFGDPDCYLVHGMRRTEEQKLGRAITDRDNKAEIDAQNKFWDRYAEEKEGCWP